MKKIIAIIFAVAFVTGCSTVSGYKPVVNERAYTKAVSQEKISGDLDYCSGLAANAAGWTKETVGDVLVASSSAAAVGAISGALIPGAVSAGTGAVIGAPIGAVVGLYYGVYEADETYKRAYNSCMSQLGHPVVW
jgi:uncharacterized protein YcfJ